jgi:hypothetical protein
MEAIKNTDIKIEKGIVISLSAKYTHAVSLERNLRLVRQYMPHFRKLLKLPTDLVIKLGPIKGRVQGRYFSKQKVAYVDVRLGGNFLEVLAHELVHAEQFFEGRLDHAMTKSGWGFKWNGSLNTNKGTTYTAYREQPWEMEAFGRQAELARKVREMLADEMVFGA